MGIIRAEAHECAVGLHCTCVRHICCCSQQTHWAKFIRELRPDSLRNASVDTIKTLLMQCRESSCKVALLQRWVSRAIILGTHRRRSHRTTSYSMLTSRLAR